MSRRRATARQPAFDSSSEMIMQSHFSENRGHLGRFLGAVIGLLVLAFCSTGCEIPLQDDGQYFACSPALECRDGYECRQLDGQFACVPESSSVGTSLDAGETDATEDTSDADDIRDIEDSDTIDNDAEQDSESEDADGGECSPACGEDFPVCFDGACVECAVAEHCIERNRGNACTDDYQCVECLENADCEDSSCVRQVSDPGENACGGITADQFLARIKSAYRRTACEAVFEGTCTAGEIARKRAGRAGAFTVCLNYYEEHFVKESLLYNLYRDAIDSGIAEVDPVAAQDCLEAIDTDLGSGTCRTLYDDFPLVCLDAFSAPDNTEGSCVNNMTCPRGSYCDRDGPDCGVCQPADTLGGAGAECDPGKSEQQCDFQQGLFCSSIGSCVQIFSVPQSITCYSDTECEVGTRCLTSGGSDRTCTGLTEVEVNDRCTGSDAYCETGTNCGSAGNCVPFKDKGDDCDPTQANECMLGFYCDGRQCREEASPGASCNSDDECPSGYGCIDPNDTGEGTCQVPPRDDAC